MAMFTICIIVVILSYLLYKFSRRNFDYWKNRGVPYLEPTPFFGNVRPAIVQKDCIGDCLGDLYRKTTHPFVGFWVLNTPHLLVRSPELIKSILVRDFNSFHDRVVASDDKADIVAANFLFMIKNPAWRDVRNKMVPAFSIGKLKNMFALINEVGDDMKSYISKNVVHKPSVECKEICAKYSTDVFMSTAFGVYGKSFIDENSPFRALGRKMFDYSFWQSFQSTCYFFKPKWVTWFKMTFFDPQVYEFLSKPFWENIYQREEKKIKRNDLIDILIDMRNNQDSNESFSDKHVLSQAIQFYAGGFETSSSSIAFTLYELCLNPHIQEKLRMEIHDTLSEYGEITYESVNKMTYLNMIVNETWRKYPVLPFIDRRCMEDYTIPNTEVVIEKGTPVFIPMMGLHYDPEFYPNPELYDPERFNEENIKNIPPYSYIPFGEGPHNCIGARFGTLVTKTGLIHIISNFSVEQNEDTPVPLKIDPRSFLMNSSVGLPIKFKNLNENC